MESRQAFDSTSILFDQTARSITFDFQNRLQIKWHVERITNGSLHPSKFRFIAVHPHGAKFPTLFRGPLNDGLDWIEARQRDGYDIKIAGKSGWHYRLAGTYSMQDTPRLISLRGKSHRKNRRRRSAPIAALSLGGR